MSRYKSLFSYYGGKSKIAHLYPKPECDTIVEPFAGGAGYSLSHHERQVILIEKNPAIAALWRYLIENSLETVLRDVPETVELGQKVADMVGPGSHPGLIALLSAQAAVAEAGQYCFGSRKVSAYGLKAWPTFRRKLEHFVPKIRHWQLRDGDCFTEAPDVEATWYVDPPYSNQYGRRYYCNQVDYESLAAWCRSRRGQVIVCEGGDAAWLPFEKLTVLQSIKRDNGAKKASVEVVWCRSSSTAGGGEPTKGTPSTTFDGGSASRTPTST